MDYHHRSGSLKQSNKGHKSTVSSKRQIGGQFSGRVENSSVSIKQKTSSKFDKMNNMKQIRDKKMKNILQMKRSGAGIAFPLIVAIIPLSVKARPEDVYTYILDQKPDELYDSELGEGCFGKPVTMLFRRLKKRITTLVCPHDLESILDATKVADLCIFVVNANGEEDEIMDSQGDLFINTLRAQGLPTSIGFVQDIDSIPMKYRSDKKKLATRILQAEIGMDAKIYDETSKNNFMRGICECNIKTIHYRNNRSYMLVDKVLTEAEHDNDIDLHFSGYLRGAPLTVHDLIHITSSNTYNQVSITIHDDPCPLTRKHDSKDTTMETSSSETTLVAQEQYIPSLDQEAPYDANNIGEQTWPTDEELHLYQDYNTEEGYGSAQADWDHTLDWNRDSTNDNDENLNNVDENGNELPISEDRDSLENEKQGMIDEDKPYNRTNTKYEETDNDLNDLALLNEENDEDMNTEEYRKKEEEEHAEFPDEVEVPLNIPARKRFMKYRGLQSLRSSAWDPYENLPVDYATLFKLDNYTTMMKSVLDTVADRKAKVEMGELYTIPESNEDDENNTMEVNDENTYKDRLIAPGTYITILIKNVEKKWVYTHKITCPILLSSVLPHEEKLSVVHMNLQRTDAWYSDTVKSKDIFTIQFGFRKIVTRPIFDNPIVGSQKAKFSRYFPVGTFMYATAYAPICYKPCPVLVFKPRTDFAEELVPVAAGNVTAVDPDRVILKKIVLTGYPIKIRRRTATVRQMFYDAKDIDWFKPIELYTKYGSIGHIKESLGTHGYMKCIFNDPITMQDTVCLALYKRVYPRKPTQEEKEMFV